ncbi:hypothetical protein COHA_006882 [Chlorella ohadii]|uniref:Uncharacterized protein n=1 Tax=Chlorella ohadii TaxID=2649997 RepID=A0AAD5DJW2_9CHLO|nr:hypothetical protein COHA_006882 [Chlorella ohadii]
MQAALAVPTAALARPRPALPARRAVRARANGPLREFREDTGEVSASQPESGSAASGSGAAQEKQQGQPKYIYADEQPPPRDTMSPEMKARLRKEYYGLGGAPNQKMGSNYFLWIILGISLLAVLSKLTGAL